MKTRTKISKQELKKTNSELVETIRLAKKNKNWLNIAGMISGPRKNWKNLNLGEIEERIKDGETVFIPGKILSGGEINKKSRIIALGFSEKAKEKLLKNKSEAILLLEEIKKNPEAKGIKILK